jgi:hypothetical protein
VKDEGGRRGDLHVAVEGAGVELDDVVQRDADVGRLVPGEAHVEGVNDSQDALVADDQHRLPGTVVSGRREGGGGGGGAPVSFHFDDDRLDAGDDVEIALAAKEPRCDEERGGSERGGRDRGYR